MEHESGSRLRDKRRAFAEAYVGEARFNATEAARIAGYKDAHNEGWRLKRNADVAAYVRERLADQALAADEVLAELSDLAMAEWRDFLDIRRDKDGEIVSVRMDLSGKVKALELLGKAHAMFTDKVDLRGEVSFADLHALAAADPGAGAGDPDAGEG